MKNCLVLGIVFAAVATIAGSACAANPVVIKVQPKSDYVYYFDRSGGYTSKWTDYDVSPNSASYYYDFSSGFGSSVSYSNTTMLFDISSLPSEFTSAVLSFNILSTNCGYGAEVGCGKLMHNGVELLRIGTQPLGWVDVDVTAQVLADKAAGNTSSFVMDFAANGYGSSGMTFASGENAELAPRLSVTAVPEPSSLLALASGAMTLGGFAFRRRKF